ncbi:hypothetical protein [Paenibacillus donghaensis]|uniref:Uncharacterized protein n=1 Tax=Paenibacillus donghaensis TaxID=414771 RepID=A0A2Z2KX64_9BACL|nr:hypothetical protein [Paenibacillus donghaensis]ASA24798.1 hypothetical protein B9T62_30990 [Paenibacillus donghaensis]
MSKVLKYVTLPQMTERRLNSEAEITLAKIRLLQSELRLREAQIVPLLSEETLREVDESIHSLHPTTLFDSTSETPSVPDYLSVRDVSKLTGLVPQVVRRHCANGKWEAEQVAGQNSTWRIKPEPFMKLSNWEAFVRDRTEGIESSKKIADHALALWDNEGPTDYGST